MAFVVTDNCINCKYTDCVQVCPVDCFREGPNFVVIEPDECIECGMCSLKCPTKAIFSAENLPPEKHYFQQLNADLAPKWPHIIRKKPELKDARLWLNKPEKAKLLQTEWLPATSVDEAGLPHVSD